MYPSSYSYSNHDSPAPAVPNFEIMHWNNIRPDFRKPTDLSHSVFQEIPI